MGKKKDLLSRFMEKVRVEESGCWRWIGTITTSGYGQFRVGDKRCMAHRVAYEMKFGNIPDGLELDHLCRNRWCVNPNHLEPVTHKENMRRSPISTGGKTHCKRGHEFTEENTRLEGKSRKRVCIKCDHLRRPRRGIITHCPHGHEYTTENTYMPPGRPRRMCRECDRIKKKRKRDECR